MGRRKFLKCAQPFAAICGIIAFLASISAPAVAEKGEDLRQQGWHATFQSTVSDTFNGCDYDLPIPVDGGYVFVCRDYNYHYSYRPDFVIYELRGSRKFAIDGEVFEGTLYRGSPTYTYVEGEFEGCDFGKRILFENGLIFQCAAYDYQYAYRPKVMIIGNYVTINGKKYQGQLYRRQ